MLRAVTDNFSQEHWTKIVEQFEDVNLIQTWAYAEAKVQREGWQVRRTIFLKGEQMVGAAQQMVRLTPIVRGGLVWINRGPLWKRPGAATDVAVLLEMLESIRSLSVDQSKLYTRIAPPLREDETDSGTLRMKGFSRVDSVLGWASARLDLSQSLETLRAGLDKRWRNSLGKAERLGLTLEIGGDNVFWRVVEMYRSTLSEKKFATNVTPDLLVRMQSLLDPDRKMWSGIATLNGKDVGGVLLARYGNTAEYLVGATTQEGRASNASQLLLWQGICQMKDLGLGWFDVGGMDEHLSPAGVLQFKQGLSAQPYRLIGEFEAQSGGIPNRLVRWRVNRARRVGG